MGNIRILDAHIANQIAAGEVVERPASVVKELVENAVDAGARRIDILLEEGGLQAIRVVDDGAGMDRADCELAFFRHATSKLASGKDLFQIRTLGFRGEALPSIAAVAKVECLTAADSGGLGTRIVIEGGDLKEIGEAAAAKGTDIRVKELFYNTPARLKYMKTIQTELGHVTDYAYRMAMAYPDISFSVQHNGTVLLHTLGNGDLLQVIAAVYGTQTAKGMIPIRADHLDFSAVGFVSRPEVTRSNRNGLTFYVNGRYIRSFALTNAVLRAYHTLLPINRFPLAVLQLGMDPSLVDANVHPAKLEVRFSKEAELVGFIEETIRSALGGQALIPQVSRRQVNKTTVIQEQLALYRRDRPLPPVAADPRAEAEMAPADQAAPSESAANRPEATEAERSPGAGTERSHGAEMERSHAAETERSPETEAKFSGATAAETLPATKADPFLAPEAGSPKSAARPPKEQPMPEPAEEPSFRSGDRPTSFAGAGGRGAYATIPQREASGTKPLRPQPRTAAPDVYRRLEDAMQGSEPPVLPEFPRLEPIGQLHGTYIVAQNEYGLFLIDQHAAHERINYEYYYEKFGNPAEASQQLLVPFTLELTPAEAERLRERLPLFEQVGVHLEPFGGGSFLVRSCPHWFPAGEEQAIVEEMADWILEGSKAPDVARLREQSAILCSCKASIKANERLNRAEMEALLDRLGACGNPYTCPHGRPIVVSFSTYELEKMFKRVM